MALTERQLANLWSRLDQLGPLIRHAEKNLADAEAAGHTRRETATFRAVITRLHKERASINAKLAADAKELRGATDDPPPRSKSTTKGTSTMGLAEDRGALQSAAATLQTAVAQQMQVVDTLETATQQAAYAISGYDNVELTEALGLIASASDEAHASAMRINAARDNIERYIGRMS